MYKYLLTILILILITPTKTTAINIAAFQDYLISAKNEISYLQRDLPKTKNRIFTNWIDDIEIRTGIDNDNDKTYTLRIRPKFNSQQNLEKEIANLTNTKNIVNFKITLNDTLIVRYKILINILEQYNNINHSTQLLSLATAKKSFFRDLADTTDFNPIKLQNTEFEITQLETKINLSSIQLKNLISSSKMPDKKQTNQAIFYWLEKLLPMIQINTLVGKNSSPLKASIENLKTYKNKIALNIAEHKYKIFQKQRNPKISYFEIKHSDKNPNNGILSIDNNNSSSFNFGISIPIGNDSVSSTSLAYNINQAYINLHNNQRETKLALENKLSTLKHLYEQYIQLQHFKDDIKVQLEDFKRTTDMQLIIRLKKEQLNLTYKLNDIHIQSLRNYIEYLHISGQLISTPLRNWIIKHQPILTRN